MAEANQTKILDNGVVLVKEDGHYYVQIDEEKLEIAPEDVRLILQNHDAVFNVVIQAKRRYWFNTAMDRYSPSEY
jgi:hypothetical protein